MCPARRASDSLSPNREASRQGRWQPAVAGAVVTCAGTFLIGMALLAGDAFVESTTGTGFVHIAPGHGTDDYELGLANNVEMPQTVGPDGRYYDHVPLFAGKAVLATMGGETVTATREGDKIVLT